VGERGRTFAGEPRSTELARRDREGALRIDDQFSAVHRLADGSRVRIRLLRPEDRERLREGFERLSPTSRFQRFLSPTPRLSEQMLDYLTSCDGTNHVAVGAERIGPGGKPGEGLGIARFIRLPDAPHVAEAAVAVVDDVQHQGLGRLLLTTLVEAAAERGVTTFRACVLPSNEHAKSFIEELALDAGPPRREDGLLVYDFPLPAASDEKPARSPIYRMLRAAAEGVTVVVRALVG